MKHFLCLICSFFLFSNTAFAEQINESLTLNGYGNISSYTSSNNKDPNKEKLDLGVGFQGRYSITENLAATAQMSISTNDAFDSLNNYDIEKKWLYLDYYLGADTTFRAGLFQLPIFQSLETGDIGYTKTWTDDPLGIYGVHGYDNFTGAEVLKNFLYDDKMFSLQFSYGVADAELGNTPNRRIYETSETDNLMGITFKIIDENYKINLGYLHAHSDLNRVNKNSGITTANGKTKLDMFALESQFSIDDFTIKAGVIDGKISRVLPDEFRYYTSLEYNIDKFTPYIYYSYEKLTNKSINPTPPAPPIVQVNEGKEKFSLGLRYELSSNSALKFSYSNEDRYRKNKNIISNIESTTRTKSDVFRLVLNVVF